MDIFEPASPTRGSSAKRTMRVIAWILGAPVLVAMGWMTLMHYWGGMADGARNIWRLVFGGE